MFVVWSCPFHLGQAFANRITDNTDNKGVILEEVDEAESMQVLTIILENITKSPCISQEDLVETIVQEVRQNITNCHSPPWLV